MKLNKTLINRKTLIKAMSSVLSLVLTANAGLELMTENIFAADGVITLSGSTVTTTSSLADNGFENFYLINLNGSTLVSKSDDKNDNGVTIGSGYDFIINKCCTLSQQTPYTFGNVSLRGGTATLSTATLKITTGINTFNGAIAGTGNNEILNYATFKMDTFNASAFASNGIQAFNNGKAWPSGKGIYGTGTIQAKSVYINSNIYNDVEGSEIRVTNTFVKDSRDINAVVIASPNTYITSEGGTFTLQVGNITKEITGAFTGKTAYEVLESPEILLYNDTVQISSGMADNGFTNYYLADINGTKVSKSMDKEEGAVSIVDGYDFKIQKCSTLDVRTPYVFGNVTLEGGTGTLSNATLKIGDEVTFNGIVRGTGNNEILNYGTINMSIFGAGHLETAGIKEFCNGKAKPSGDGIYGTGKIIAENVAIDSDIYTDVEGSEIIVESVFEKGNQGINSTVIAQPDTNILSKGGSFKLKVGEAEKMITGSAYGKAIDLLDDPGVSLGDIPDPYYGTTYDFSNMISTASGYDSSKVYLEYSKDQHTILSEKPDVPGYYYVRAVAPVSGSYREATTAWKSFVIYYLAPDVLYPSGAPYFTVSGTVNGKYIPEALVFTAPDGVLIGCPTLPDFEDFSSSVTLTEEDLYVDGHVNEDLEVVLVRASDGARTAGKAVSYFISDISEYVYDHYDPVFEAFIVDAEGGMLETSVDEEDAVIVADELDISVYDDNLKSVIMEVDGTKTDLSSKISSGQCDITLYGTVAKYKTVTITATDMANRVSEASFKLYHEPVDPSLSVTIPDTIYVGDDYTPDIITNSDGDIKVEYSNGSVTSAEPFTKAGTYNLSVNVSATDYYNEASYNTEYTILKKTPVSSVTVADIYVGGTVNPVFTSTSDGKSSVTFEYKKTDAPDTAYSTVVPSAAGTYTVRATVVETDAYLQTVCTDTFTIKKYVAKAEVSVENIFVGGEVKPVVTTESDGKASFEYKLSTAPDTDYSATVPSAAGSYTVKATVPETDTYLGTTCTTSFTISKITAVAEVSVEDIFVGGEVKPVVTTESDGKASFEYKASTAPDSEYSSEVPATAGSYTVRVTIPETDAYLGTTCTDTFAIKKFVVKGSVSVEDIFVGGKVNPVVTTESDGKATFEYRSSSASASSYSSVVPTAAGTYTVRATIAETDTYEKIVCTSEFTISLNKVTLMELSIKDFFVGQSPDIVYQSNSDGKMTVMYKRSDAPDTAYTEKAPTQPGKYTARATVPATDIYEGASCTTEFSISYLDAPDTIFVPFGTAGKNGYFKSDVVLNAPKGFTISTTFGENYALSIPYSEDMTVIYLKRDDGALTTAIPITKRPLIDKTAPTLTTSSGEFDDGATIYAANLNVDISDTNLASLTINNEKVDLSTLKGNKLNLSSGLGTTEYKIVAEDIAGNITTIDFILKAEWLESGVILPGVALPLSEDESYTLDSGSWTVTMTSDGNIVEDTTVYNGDMPVYVNEGGDYTFTKVS